MDRNQIIGTIASAPVVLAVTAYLRKLFPAIDGRGVLCVVLALSTVATLLSLYSDRIPAAAWPVIATLVTTVTAAGGSAYVDSRIGKGSGS